MNIRRITKRLAGLFLLTMLFLALASPALAFEPQSGERVVIEQGQVIEDDLYVGANVFILEGTIKGDLIAGGSVIVVESTGVVEGDLLAMGQGIVINGTVEDDARIAGAMLSVGGDAVIGGDLMAFGYSLEVSDGSAIGGDLVVYASQASLLGSVARDVQAGVGGLRIDAQIGGDVQAEIGDGEDMPSFNPFMFMPTPPEMPGMTVVPGGLSVGAQAKIGGDLTYTAAGDAEIPAGAVEGEVIRKKLELPPPPTPEQQIGAWFLKLLRALATLLIVGFLMAWLVPDFVRNGASVLQAQPLHGLLWGLLVYVGFFFVIFLVLVVIILLILLLGMITLGDLVRTVMGVGMVTVSSLVLTFRVAVSYISKILVGFLVGRLLLARFRPDLGENPYWPLVLGVVIFAILWSIPILGTVVNVVVVLLGLGALWLLGRDWYSGLRGGETPVAPPTPAD